MIKKLMLVAPIVLFLFFGLALWLNWFPYAENAIYDRLLMSEREPADNIIIIGIDERSIAEIGTWPWPRYYMAEAIEKLLDMGVAAIGVDILYDNYGPVTEYDQRLVEAVRRSSDRVVMGAVGVFKDDIETERLQVIDYLLPFEELNNVANTAFLNVIPDSDGIIRRALTTFAFGDETKTAFAIEIYRTYKRSLELAEEPLDDIIPTDRFGRYNIDYVGKAGTFTMLSLWDVINGNYPPEIYKDAIALIGPYAYGIGSDNYFTPIDRRIKTYGIEIHANTIQNLLQRNFKRSVHWGWNLAALAFFAFLSAFFYIKLKPALAAVAAVLMIVAQLVAAKLMYDHLGLIFACTYVLLFLVTAYLLQQILSVARAQHEKAHIRGLFGRFVAPEVVKEIISGNVSVELGGVLRDVTVLFVDIRGFTAFSEAHPPEKVVAMVNRYLNLTSTSIQQNGGTIDKYIGDATMAVFNAPNDLENHALCGVKAAWAMKVGSEPLRKEILQEFGVDLQFGIGVNTGQAVVGNMGSEFRMDYTVIGDTVNTAARLESSAQKGQIIISDAVYQQIKNHVEAKDLGELMVKNKKDGIHIYEVQKILEQGEGT